MNTPIGDEFERWTFECIENGLPPPMPLNVAETMNWFLVSSLREFEVHEETPLVTATELLMIPHIWYEIPFCHPGSKDENEQMYYLDSMVQIVKVKLSQSWEERFVCHLIGYEDT